MEHVFDLNQGRNMILNDGWNVYSVKSTRVLFHFSLLFLFLFLLLFLFIFYM
jgi:hypothetical protein